MRKPKSPRTEPVGPSVTPPVGAAANVGPDADCLLQGLPWGVMVLDAKGTVRRLNQQAAYWWGMPRHDVQGRQLGELPAGALPAELQQALQRMISTPVLPHGEFFLPQHQQWIAMSSARQGDDWVVYWQDVTAQKQRESHHQARQAASDALRRRTEAVARTGSYELELATGQFHFSDGLCRLFGEDPGTFEPDQALIDARSHPDDVGVVQQVLGRALESRQSYYYQRRIYRPDGQLRTLECHGRVDCNALGEPVKLLGLVQDVTEREQAAQELLRVKDELMQRATDNYLTLYNLMDEGFCIVEVLFDAAQHPTDYRFLDVNPAFEKQTGLRGALGKTVRELVPAIEPVWADVYGRVAQTGEPTRFEANVESMDRWFDINTFPIGTLPNRHVAVLFTDITERKRTEESLRRSEEQFRLLVTATSDTVYRMNADWTQMEQLIGNDFLSDAQQSTRTWVEEYLPDDDQPLVKATIADAIKHKALLELEHRVRRADGTVGWTYSRAIPMLDANGKVTGWLGAASDVSARKQAEADLRESEQRQRLLIENMPGAAVFVVDRELCYQLAAGEALRPVGFEPADFRGRTVREITPPTLWPVFQNLFEQALAGHAFEYEHEQGGRSFMSRGVPLPGPNGQIDAVLAVSFDITDGKAAEAALQVSETKYRTLFETMDQGFGIGEVSPAGPGRAADFRWLEVNPQVERLTGMTQTALLGGEAMRTIMPQLQDSWYERSEQVALTGESVRFEQYAQVLGRWFDVHAYALDPDGPAPHRIALLFTNITARKQAEDDLRQAEERNRAQLEQQVAERTQALRESRNLLQTVFDASPTAIVVMRLLHDAAGRAEDFEILIYNEFNTRVVGRDDLAGQRFSAMFPQTVPTDILARLLAVATTGKPADFEQWYEGEGMRHWFRHIVVRQDDLLVLTSEVITARKLLEQAQAQSFALLQQSESVASMGSWEYDLHTQKFTWSDGLYHLLERPVGSTIKLQLFLDVVLDDDRPAAARLMRTLTTGASAFDTTLRLRISDVVKTVRFKAVPLPEAPGPPERVLGVCLDVSDVQRLEAENLTLRLDQHKELLLAILQAQETERQRLGEVLHNGLGQVLYATKLHLDQLDSPVLHAQPELSGLYRQTGRLLADAMRQTRTLAHELVPTSILQYGLAAAVRDVCRDLSSPQLVVDCHVWGEEQVLPQSVQVTLFRLVQELVHNIVRHAQATQATLELETLPGGVSLRAEDNGHGFDTHTVAEGLGLRTVRDAVTLLNGTMAIDSSPEFGTHIRLRIPLPLFS